MSYALEAAEIWYALGDSRADLYYQIATEEATDEREQLESDSAALCAIDVVLTVVEPSKVHVKSHNGEQWKTCAACLAGHLSEMIP